MMDLVQIERMLASPREEERLQGLKLLARCDSDPNLSLIYQTLGDESWRIRKEAAEIFLALPQAGDLAGEVIELLHSQENAGLRNTAVEILVSLGRRAVPFLLEELGCSDHDVRKFVLDILGEIRDPETVGAIIRSLSDSDGNVRAAAAENLGKIGSDEAVPALLDSLENSDLLFRFTVLESLGQIGAAVPVEKLLPFRNEKLLRKPLFDCLGHIGATAAVPVLIEGLIDSVRNVREAAAVSLERIFRQSPREVESFLAATGGGPVPEALADLLDSGHLHGRRAAALLLGVIGDGRFAGRLVALFKDPEVRESALAALVALGRTAACSVTGIWPEADGATRACLAFVMGEARCDGGELLLLEGLGGSDPELRIISAQALAKLGEAEAIAPLAHLFEDPSEEVREAARLALSHLAPSHPERTFSVVRPFSQGENPRQRMLAVQVLGALPGGTDVESALALAMKDESSLVRQAAIGACESRVGPRQMAALKLALTDEDGEVRQRAVELLGAMDNPESIQALGSALRDEDLWVRTTAVRALGRIGGREAAEMVVGALSDPVGLVTIAALEVLSALDSERAHPYLEGALQHSDEEVVNAALKLLTAHGQTAWIPGVRDRLINHSHWDVRVTFARALVELVGPDCRKLLEGRLLVEGEDLVRHHLQELLDGLDGGGD